MSLTAEERKVYNKAYYDFHKSNIMKKNREKVTCECGSTVSASSYKRHLSSDLHKGKLLRKLQDAQLKKIIKKIK